MDKEKRARIKGMISDMKADLKEVKENIEYWEERRDEVEMNIADMEKQLEEDDD